MDKLVDLAKMIRSKNSGPFLITLDALFSDQESYLRVKNSNVINRESIMKAYKLSESQLKDIVFFDSALGVKITYERSISSGTSGDRDVYGAQQHAPLMEILVP